MVEPPRRKPIDGWVLLRLIRRGGQAQVYEAVKGEGDPVCAFKRIKSANPQKRARFVQEVRRHLVLVDEGARNIIPILDHNLDAFEAGRKEGFIVMPLAETTFEQRVALFVGRVELCLEVFHGIVSGIREAHAAGIIHRDLKPANILFLDASLKTPYISDFGICFVKGTPDEARLTRVDETVGARFYMAPEQERGGKVDVTEAADIYALGKVLHFMLTGRNLFREELENAFTAVELEADPRLEIIRQRVLARTIVANASDRMQTADELLTEVEAIRRDLGSPPGGPPVPRGGPEGPSPPQNEAPTSSISLKVSVVDQLDIRSAYRQATSDILHGQTGSLVLWLDQCKNSFRSVWSEMHRSIEKLPDQATQAAQALIQTQTEAIGLVLAIARLDATTMRSEFRKFLEKITRASEGHAGYVAVSSVPHVLAGFLYMTASVASFASASWKTFSWLMQTKFEWYYQSGRPSYSLGFDHPYFFHPEAIGRKATAAHDLYRRELSQPSILDLLGLEQEEMLNAYLQTQMVMCLRAAQEIERGNDVRVWADFGRFYEHRVTPLLERVKADNEYAEGLLQAFEESRNDWFSKLNTRLELIRSRFWGGGFFWESVSSYPLDQ